MTYKESYWACKTEEFQNKVHFDFDLTAAYLAQDFEKSNLILQVATNVAGSCLML